MFLEQCMKEYSEQGEKPFAVKHLNILDPIRCKSGNNLGRSVNVGGCIIWFSQPLLYFAVSH